MATSSTVTNPLGTAAQAFSPSTVGQVTGQESTLAGWAAPYVTQMLGQAQALGQMPYQVYQGPLTAGESPLQQQAFQGIASLGIPSDITGAAQTAANVAQQAGGMGYMPSYFGSAYQAPSAYQPSNISAQNVSAPSLTQYSMGPAQEVSGQQLGTPLMGTAQTGYNPNLQTFQMGPVRDVRTQSFAQPSAAESYMSPYMQSVVERQQQAAQREADIQRQALGAQFAQAGGLGGGRFGVQQARAAEALARQKGDIQSQGLQSAFQQAQQQFNTEQAARLQAQQANQQAQLARQQANLQAQLGVQQLGTQTGLQTSLANLSAQQQANVQNQAAQLQTQGLTAQQALQAALANQQAGLTVGQQNLAAQLGIQQLGAGQGLQAQLANQQAQMQAQQLAEQARQYGYGQQMTGAQLGAQYGLAGQQAAEQSRQFGAQYGLQGLAQQLAAAQARGQLGVSQANVGLQNLAQLLGAGATQRDIAQQGVAADLAEFQRQQQWPYQQLQFQQAMLQGMPLQAVNYAYQQPSYFSNLMTGTGGLMDLYSRLFPQPPK